MTTTVNKSVIPSLNQSGRAAFVKGQACLTGRWHVAQPKRWNREKSKGGIMGLWMKNACLAMFAFCIVSTANAEQVSKTAWINAMSTALPTAFCQPHQYFRQCFDVTQIECEETALSATRICLQKHKAKIPNVLNQPNDGAQWGSIVGSCAGETYENVLREHRVNSNVCNDPANWR